MVNTVMSSPVPSGDVTSHHQQPAIQKAFQILQGAEEDGRVRRSTQGMMIALLEYCVRHRHHCRSRNNRRILKKSHERSKVRVVDY
ncbi:hypothetical protein ScPMuIL_018620 [Solemya velum]